MDKSHVCSHFSIGNSLLYCLVSVINEATSILRQKDLWKPVVKPETLTVQQRATTYLGPICLCIHFSCHGERISIALVSFIYQKYCIYIIRDQHVINSVTCMCTFEMSLQRGNYRVNSLNPSLQHSYFPLVALVLLFFVRREY